MEKSILKNLFVREEEQNPLFLDRFDRFPFSLSENKNVLSPIVSSFLFDHGFKPIYPDNKQFAVCLSHDIDFLYKTTRQKISRFSKNPLGNRFYNFSSLLSKSIDPEYDIKKLIELENQFNFVSSYYFLSLEKGDQDFNYNTHIIPDLSKLIVEQGSEIGLHGGHKAFKHLEQLKTEKNRIENSLDKEIKSYRNHYLRFNYHTSLNLLEQAGFQTDSTVGFSEIIGFRNGICYPFRPYNLESKKFLNIIEVPLIVMDTCLFENMKLKFETAKELYLLIRKEVQKVNGVLTVLWHNNNVTNEIGRLYKFILEDIHKQNAYVSTTENISNFWKESGQLEKMEEILTSELLSDGK